MFGFASYSKSVPSLDRVNFPNQLLLFELIRRGIIEEHVFGHVDVNTRELTVRGVALPRSNTCLATRFLICLRAPY